MAFASLFGANTKLLSHGGASVAAEDIGGKHHAFVMLYFSAHWCPPCRKFTPVLAELYKELKIHRKDIEIVFVSGDKNESDFNEYFQEMPWLALPLSEKSVAKKLNQKFKIEGIPSLVLLDGEGVVVNKDAANAIRKLDTNEERIASFPWKQRTLKDVLASAKITNKQGEPVTVESLQALEGFALYFSAHWCPPCRGFTPSLIELYKKLKAKRNVEFIFVSSDRSDKEWSEYYHEMPWSALERGSPAKDELSEICEVDGIPTLVTINNKFEIISTKARGAAGSDPEGDNFPWAPMPLPLVTELTMDEEKVDALNSNMCAFLSGATIPESVSSAFTAAANLVEAARGGCELGVTFFTVGAPGSDLFTRIKAVVGIPVPEDASPFVLLMHLGPNKTASVISGELSEAIIAEKAIAFYRSVAQDE